MDYYHDHIIDFMELYMMSLLNKYNLLMYIRILLVYKSAPFHSVTTDNKKKFQVLSFTFILLCEFIYLNPDFCHFYNLHTCRYYMIYYQSYMICRIISKMLQQNSYYQFFLLHINIHLLNIFHIAKTFNFDGIKERNIKILIYHKYMWSDWRS